MSLNLYSIVASPDRNFRISDYESPNQVSVRIEHSGIQTDTKKKVALFFRSLLVFISVHRENKKTTLQIRFLS